MNHDAPMTPAAMQAHIAELEQQLKLSDEGVSQLAQRCLELEQQLLACQTELAKHSAEAENITLTLPQLFYDTGSGFSPRECLTATEDVYNELTHEVSVTFVLPEDARAIRLDPGELACCITDLAISDERISFQSVNGLLLQEDSLLFFGRRPQPFAALHHRLWCRHEVCGELSLLPAGTFSARAARQVSAAGAERPEA